MRVTPDMRLALRSLAARGVDFYPISALEARCGCRVYEGYLTDTCEPSVQWDACGPDHGRAFERARARWDDPDVNARFHDAGALDTILALFAEETR